MFLESQAVLRTMLALKDAGIPSLSVHDSLLVPRDCTQQAKDALSSSYAAMTGAIPFITNTPITPITP
jgi:hypothetical protein